MDEVISLRIRFFSFVSMVLLVYIHGYNFVDHELRSNSFIHAAFDTNNYIQYFLVNGLFRFRIPLLMLISGYLLAYKSHLPYVEVVLKRIQSLAIPYLLVSAIGLTYIFLIESVFYSSNPSDCFLGDKKLIHYSAYQLLYRWIMEPFAFQLWYLKMLFMFTVSLPGLLFFLNKIPKTFLVVLFFLRWIYEDDKHSLIFYFALGMYLQQIQFDLINYKFDKYLRLRWVVVFSLVCIHFKAYIAFKHPAYLGNYAGFILTSLSTILVSLLTIAFWYGSDAVVLYFMRKPFFFNLTKTSFFIYAFHEPIIWKLIKPVSQMFHEVYLGKLVAFFTLPFAVVIFCILLDWFTFRYSPKFYGILTGNRGHAQKTTGS